VVKGFLGLSANQRVKPVEPRAERSG